MQFPSKGMNRATLREKDKTRFERAFFIYGISSSSWLLRQDDEFTSRLDGEF